MDQFRNEPINLLEIGLWCPYFPGASIKAWSEYFKNSNYFGIDIVDCTQEASEKIHIGIVDQTSEAELKAYIDDKPKFKFIIDDGCHEEQAILTSLSVLFPKLENGGVYFIEDLHVVNSSIIKNMVNEGKIKTNKISKESCDYINENIKTCKFELNEKLCIIIKK